MAFVIGLAWVSLIVTIAGMGGFAPGVGGPFPTPVLPFLILVGAGSVLWRAWPAFRRAVLSVPLVALVGINGVRVAGVFFLLLHIEGRLAAPFSTIRRLGRHHCRRPRDSPRSPAGMEGHGTSPAVRRMERYWRPRSVYGRHSRSIVGGWDTISRLHGSSRHRRHGNAAVGRDSVVPGAALPANTSGGRCALRGTYTEGVKTYEPSNDVLRGVVRRIA